MSYSLDPLSICRRVLPAAGASTRRSAAATAPTTRTRTANRLDRKGRSGCRLRPFPRRRRQPGRTQHGGDRMNDNRKWQVARLDDIERRGRDIPVREHLGIHAFGINAYTPGEDGTLINEHDEAGSGQEELYIVLDGNATFEVDGETVDARPGTLVFVGPESRRKATGDGTVLAVGAAPGEAYQGVDWGGAWPFPRGARTAYGEQRDPHRLQ